jgi:hypothetical protein
MGIDKVVESQPDTKLNLFNSGLLVDLRVVEKKLAKNLLKIVQNINIKNKKRKE